MQTFVALVHLDSYTPKSSSDLNELLRTWRKIYRSEGCKVGFEGRAVEQLRGWFFENFRNVFCFGNEFSKVFGFKNRTEETFAKISERVNYSRILKVNLKFELSVKNNLSFCEKSPKLCFAHNWRNLFSLFKITLTDSFSTQVVAFKMQALKNS